ncbi:hypothetical protein ACLKA7_001638 [Drosophila subpalustris]
MVTMENSEEILQILERFTRLKQKEIPKELEDYLQYVAKTGDTMFKWSSLKYLFREKLLSVIKHFNEDSQRLEEIPNYPNVDPFNYETMKSSLLERLDLFNAAPFTVQRLCELLIDPRKQYSRIDKFMRALEKNILVVSTIDPGRKRTESENGDSLDSVGNGDLSLEVNIDIEMENENIFNNVDERNGCSEEANSGALKATCPRSDDAPVQPKAKKAKLDYDETKLDYDDNEQRDGANDDVEDEPIENKPEADQVDADADVADAAEAVDAAEEATEFQKSVETDAAVEAAEIDEPDDEENPKGKKPLNGKNEQKESPETANDIPAAVESDVVPDAAKETTADSPAKNESTDAVDHATVEQQPKIIEKQELESAEKVEKPSPIELTEKKIEEAASAAVEDKKETEAEPLKLESDDKTEKPAQTTPEKAVAVAANESTAVEPKATAKKDADGDVTTAVVDAKTETELETTSKADINETNTEKTEIKADPKPAKEAADAANPADVVTAAPVAVAVTVTPPAAEEKEDQIKTAVPEAVASAEPAADTAAVADAAASAPASAPASAEGATPAVSIEADEVATPQSPPPTAASATVETATPTDSDGGNFADSAAPTSALIDQPMEDTPAEEDTQASPSAAVEEVVMAESGAASGAGDMATDEVAKDEPAAMEVDDTSQEVMDQ